MTKQKPNRLAEAIIEMAGDQHRLGIMDTATHEKITLRHLGDRTVGAAEPISGEEGRAPVNRRI